ncbi:choice-of-anchor J domain-containing protein [Chryseosolibacter indicus]|uniref:Zinc metalloprotease n=1 Tax=Chryseosolibacter indicus TaxID=2782351 RepID=A0ABS5VY66_9BACT|nr:choice-of-anchor J domain-containing protein [Chryseosolibacter indicus]MBT1706181.1 zinc metalloprotease [Chryseosolibacter indicus]
MSRGQDRCGTVEYGKSIKIQSIENEQKFEKWLEDKIKSRSAKRTKSGPYKIPVVVHVIHRGEAVGAGTNISDAQILSQLKVLNDDYRRQNEDASSTDPAFVSVAGSMDIQFVLAKRTPEGFATNGIVRVKGPKSSYTSSDNYTLKSLSYWPSENYLNIWVCNITDYLGYAQFPQSDLPGLDNSSSNALTDGLVISYEACGSIDDGNFNLDPDYNKGRTATHEIGHFFGLRHIWGDENACTGTDYIDDTPNQASQTTYCPQSSISDACSPKVMFQNFMDYTDDACMNLFTAQQVQRMIAVLENSPRRATLLTSPGLLPPDPVANDIGIRKFVSPLETECSNNIVTSVQIRNYGSNNVSTARIRLRINGAIIETKDFSLSLQPLDSAVITFSNHALSNGFNTVAVEIVLTNGVADGDPASNNNIVSLSVLVPENVPLPYREDFSTFPENWYIQNFDEQLTWQLANGPNFQTDNKALLLPFYDYSDNLGELDVIYSPVFNLSTTTAATLFFDIAYMPYSASKDGLRVVAITDCSTLSEGVTIYEKSGSELATTSRSKPYFIPNKAADWRREMIDLTSFAGNNHVQLAFIGINDYGNNLYIDNISVVTPPVLDVSLNSIIQPSTVTGLNTVDLVINSKNTGGQVIQSIQIEYVVNNAGVAQRIFDVNILPGQEANLTIPAVKFAEGENTLEITATSVNGIPDQFGSNNALQTKVVVNHAQDKIPLRQNFDALFDNSWTITNVDNGILWKPLGTNYDQSLYFRSFGNTDIGDQSWLVSPSLDFTSVTQASATFDLAYVTANSRQEDLRILVSIDNGRTYEEVDFVFPEPSNSTGSWAPQNEEDWFNDIYVNLSQFAGEANVRIAFVITNANSNNLYIDNIEFFISERPGQVSIETPYNIFGYSAENPKSSDLKIGFNLGERQWVTCEIIDVMGKQIASVSWQDVLNQVYELPPYNSIAPGVYIVRLRIGNKLYSERIFITDF